MVAFVGVGRVCVRVCARAYIEHFYQYTTAGTE